MIKIINGQGVYGITLFKYISFSITIINNNEIVNINLAIGMWSYYASITLAKVREEWDEYTITTNIAES